jgi:hypothetical protein
MGLCAWVACAKAGRIASNITALKARRFLAVNQSSRTNRRYSSRIPSALGLWPAGRSHVAVGVTWAERRNGIEVE